MLLLLPQAQSPQPPLEFGGLFAPSAAEQMQRPRVTKDFPATLQDVAARVKQALVTRPCGTSPAAVISMQP